MGVFGATSAAFLGFLVGFSLVQNLLHIALPVGVVLLLTAPFIALCLREASNWFAGV